VSNLPDESGKPFNGGPYRFGCEIQADAQHEMDQETRDIVGRWLEEVAAALVKDLNAGWVL